MTSAQPQRCFGCACGKFRRCSYRAANCGRMARQGKAARAAVEPAPLKLRAGAARFAPIGCEPDGRPEPISASG